MVTLACVPVTTDQKIICRKWARGSGPGPGDRPSEAVWGCAALVMVMG